MAVNHCGACKALIVDYEKAIYVKPKKGPARYYCEKCVKGSVKNDTSGKRH